MTSNVVLVSVGACAGVGLLIALSIWSRTQALATLRRWAQSEGLELVSAKRRSFVPLWCSGRGYQFFRVSVREKGDGTRRAWIRCLDFNSAEPHNFEVTWDEKVSGLTRHGSRRRYRALVSFGRARPGAAAFCVGHCSRMNHSERHSDLGRVAVVATTALLLLSCWWTLQAFMPEPYFLRTPYQLRVMSTPNGVGEIQRSLLPFYATAMLESVALGALAIFAWFSKTTWPALCYLIVVVGMAGITLSRVAEAFRGLY